MVRVFQWVLLTVPSVSYLLLFPVLLEKQLGLLQVASQRRVLWIQQMIQLQIRVMLLCHDRERKLSKLVTKLPLIPELRWIHCNPRNGETIFTQRFTLT
ncbi:hypothetical protein UY3_10530 [Chelonia mydas]|uniref:Uncharacterized protein n=1 Tax=Chelonia mydas TaxID=8469 RepID=M7BJZ8_CHEMY|nr:hypothetical protein UY3_10530 [Chelonia mydas]